MKNPTIVFTIIDGATTVANNGIYISIAKAPNAIAVKIKTDPLINVPINDIILFGTPSFTIHIYYFQRICSFG